MHDILAMFRSDFVRMLADHWLSEFRDFGELPFESIAEYIDFFPLVICPIWSIYGVICLLNSFRRRPIPETLPSYCVIIPFYSEPAGALRTAQSVAQVHPPPDEILLVDDGSPDEEECAHVLAILPPNTRVLRLTRTAEKPRRLMRVCARYNPRSSRASTPTLSFTAKTGAECSRDSRPHLASAA